MTQPAVHEIAPGLYLGSAQGLDYLEQFRITHVLSLLVKHDYSRSHSAAVRRIKLADEEENSLLKSLPEGLNFIHTVLTGHPLLTPDGKQLDENIEEQIQQLQPQQRQAEPRVYVHCRMGISRSSSMVIAYLMKTRNWTFDEALAHVKLRRCIVKPNLGFQKQLQLFADMQYTLDATNPDYRIWCLQYAGTTHGFSQGHSSYYPPLEGDCCSSVLDSTAAERAKEDTYRCAGCDAVVATQRNVLRTEHIAASHKWCTARLEWLRDQTAEYTCKQPAYNFMCAQTPSGISEQTSVFMEPLEWMGSKAKWCSFGDLACPGCKAVIGHYNWKGIITQELNRIAPAFYLKESSLLKIPAASVAAVMGPSVDTAAEPVPRIAADAVSVARIGDDPGCIDVEMADVSNRTSVAAASDNFNTNGHESETVQQASEDVKISCEELHIASEGAQCPQAVTGTDTRESQPTASHTTEQAATGSQPGMGKMNKDHKIQRPQSLGTSNTTLAGKQLQVKAPQMKTVKGTHGYKRAYTVARYRPLKMLCFIGSICAGLVLIAQNS